jgi:hypothetical protein
MVFLMRLLTIVLLCFVSLTGYSQAAKPTKTPDQKSTTPEPVYLTPTGQVNDTLEVYAVLASIKEPLLMQSYRLITKNWVYEKGEKKVADQYLEKVVDGNATLVNNWRKRVIFIVEKKDFSE